MPQQLVVVAGPDKGRVFKLAQGEMVSIGRSLKNDVSLCDPFVSRNHCWIHNKDGQVLVIDREGSTGTYVNDARIAKEQLREGSQLGVGRTKLLYTTGASVEQDLGFPDLGGSEAELPVVDEPLSRLAGQSVSRYEIGRVLGRGKTGVVFQAVDSDDQRIVALKVFHAAWSRSESDKRRLVRAMKSMLPLEHPNLVNIYNAGKTGEHCWIAMEYVQGKSMAQIISRIAANAAQSRRRVWKGSSTVSRGWWLLAMRWAIHLCRALEFAHENGIVHRNVTPRNILVRERDNVGKLGDLMLAKALEGPHTEDITQPGQLLGELEYMSPERTYGARKLDQRSDLYGLGAAVYAMLAGRAPLVGKSRQETISMIREAKPARPQTFQPTIPESFEDLVLAMLAKDPEDRPQSASAVLKQLDDLAHRHRLRV
jgi:serine/threonine-protein kinase